MRWIRRWGTRASDLPMPPPSSLQILVLEEVFKEKTDLLHRFGIQAVFFAIGHGDAIVVAEDFVDGDGVIEGAPGGGSVFGASGDQERPRGHEDVELDEVMAVLDELFVR